MATEQAPIPTETATASDGGPEPIPTRDYTKLLVTPDEGEAAESAETSAETVASDPVETATEPEPTEQTTETPAGEAETVETEAAKPATETTTARPGTPDKVLQQMQQDLSAAVRKIEELTAKRASGETLTAKEEAEVTKQERKLDLVRANLKAKGAQFDLLEDGMGEAIAQTLDEHDRSTEELREELKQTKAEVAAMRRETEAQKADANWRETQAKYPGVNVRDVWEKAAADAIEASGFTAEEVQADPKLARAIQNVASRSFHERAGAATKRVTPAKETPTPPATKKPTATRNAPAVTPGGARVAQSSGVTPASEPDEHTVYRNKAVALVRD